MTYPNPDVITAVTDRFVPVKLDLFKDRPIVRQLNVIWTPTILIADRRGTVHYQSVNFLPAADFLDMLDISEANAMLRWGRNAEALARLRETEARHPDGPLIPEAIYWRGIAAYLTHHTNAALDAEWIPLHERFPDSAWAHRIPWPPSDDVS